MEIPYTLTARPDTGLYNGKLGIWLFLASEVMLFGAIFTSYLFMRIGAEDGTWPTHIQSVPMGLANTIILIISSITMVWAWVALKERKFNTYRVALGITILCGLVFLTIKGFEYHSKFNHFGMFIKADAMDKYLPALQKMDAYVGNIPSQHVFEVRSEDVKSMDGDSFVVVPDKNFHAWNSPAKKDTEAAAGGEEETIAIAKDDVLRSGYLLPNYGTYYAIYFFVTGLHALHIIGGVIVMTYFLTIGSKLYKRNPEQLSNRIEVTGIFWHFVDLVWITVFPILYLT
jgi:cytochrome c oxidase subunit III